MNTQTTTSRRGLVPGLCLAVAALAIFTTPAYAQSLGSAESFAVLGASTVTNTGATHVNGSVGVSPGTAITGFPPGIIANGAIHAGDDTAAQAHADLGVAYEAFAGLESPPAKNMTGVDLGGKTLGPGVYRFNGSATSAGMLTFDAKGDAAARFVVQIGTTLVTSGNSAVALINGANARNVFFQVGTSATLGAGSSFIGNILAHGSITTVSGTDVKGRLLALTAAVTLDTNDVTMPMLSTAGVKADFDGDGDGDFALENTNTGERVIRFLENGQFQSTVSLGTSSLDWQIVGAADFNADGYSDVVRENSKTGERRIWMLRRGVLQDTVSAGMVSTEWHIAGAADFNGDGHADLVGEKSSTGEHIIWLLRNGVYQSSLPLGRTSTEWQIAAAADFNGDGFADVVRENTQTGERRITFLRKGVFQSNITVGTTPINWRIAGAADFDGDGSMDLVAQNRNTGERSIWFLRNGAYRRTLALPNERNWNIADY